MTFQKFEQLIKINYKNNYSNWIKRIFKVQINWWVILLHDVAPLKIEYLSNGERAETAEVGFSLFVRMSESE